MLQAELSELQRQLKAAPHASMRDVLLKSSTLTHSANVDENSAVQASRSRLLARVAEQSEQRSIDELHTAHRLTGITAVRLRDHGDNLAIRLDTSFDGQPRQTEVGRYFSDNNCAGAGRFYESYYVLFIENADKMMLDKHTVPYFVPMRALAEQLLDQSPDRFLQIASDYCNALVSRRQQCEVLKRFAAVADVGVTDAFDFVQLAIVSERYGEQLLVLAAFDNLRSGKPTRLDVLLGDAQRPLHDVAARLTQHDRLDEAVIHEFQLANVVE